MGIKEDNKKGFHPKMEEILFSYQSILRPHFGQNVKSSDSK